jgi:hypothetical protein
MSSQSDVLGLYQAQAQEKLDGYNKKTSRQRYAKSEAYVAFRQSIYVGFESYDLILMPDTAVGSTAPRRGNAACSGIPATRLAMRIWDL